MNPATDHPLSLPQTTLSMAVAHKSGGSFHLGKVTDLFITSLRHPLEPSLMLHNWMLQCAAIGQCLLSQANERWLLLNEKVAKKHMKCDYQILSNYPCMLKATLGSVLYLYWNSVMPLINSLFTFTSQTVHTQGLNILDICLLAQMWWMD